MLFRLCEKKISEYLILNNIFICINSWNKNHWNNLKIKFNNVEQNEQNKGNICYDTKEYKQIQQIL